LVGYDQEPINDVLSHYNLEVSNVVNECYKGKKGVWWVYTSDGDKVLKKVSNSEATLKFILSGVDHLIKNGVKIPKIEITKENMNYVKIDKTCYVLSQAIKGTKLNANDITHLEIIMRELGRFHKASIGFSQPFDSKAKNHLGTWIEEYSYFLEDMSKFYLEERSKKGISLISRLIVQEFPYFYNRGQKAIEGLKGSEYKNWVIKTNNTGSLCHQDFSYANLLQTTNGLYVLDTDSLTIDLPARDIRKILNKTMKKNLKWDLQTVKNILKFYSEENKLLAQEWKVVMYDLMFPHLFLGAMDKYYYKRDSTWTEENYYNRIKEMVIFEKTITPLFQNFDLIIPK
jgi:spore coat-associated protein S